MTHEEDHEAWIRSWLEAHGRSDDLPVVLAAALERLWTRASDVLGPSILEALARPAFTGAGEKFRCMAHVHLEAGALYLDGLRACGASISDSEVRDGFRFLLTEVLTALGDAAGSAFARSLRGALAPEGAPEAAPLDPRRAARDRAALIAVTRLLARSHGTPPWSDLLGALGAAVPLRSATVLAVRGGHARIETWHIPSVSPEAPESHARIAFGGLAGPSVAAATVEVQRYPLPALPADSHADGYGDSPADGPADGPAGLRAAVDPAVAPAAETREYITLPLSVAATTPFGLFQLQLAAQPSPDDLALVAAIASQIATSMEIRETRRDADAPEVRSAAGDIAQRELVSVISHDLRNPLSAILMSVALLLRAVPPADGRRDGRKQLEVIKRSADQMNRMIQNLVDASVLEADALSVHPQPERLAPLVTDAFDALRSLAANRSVTLESEIPEDLSLVLVQRDRMVQALANVITLGIKFSVGHGAITVRARRDGAEVRVEVRDTGPGLPAEDLPHMFDRVWWARRGARMGTGLGLFVARGIVEAHRGRLWVDSHPGEGSTFHLSLPAVPQSPAEG